MKITIEKNIFNCDNCPYAEISKVYTPDSWDDIRKIYCSQLKEIVYSYLDWNGKSPIPAKCPYNKGV